MEVGDVPIPDPAAVLMEGPDRRAMLLDAETGSVLALNSSGALVWRLVDGKRTVRRIAEEVRRLFDDAPAGLETDVAAFLELLHDDGFVGRELIDSPRDP